MHKYVYGVKTGTGGKEWEYKKIYISASQKKYLDPN